MTKPFQVLAIIVILICTSCNNAVKLPDIKKAGWLTGTWKNSSPDGTSFEIWGVENDTTYSGKSFIVRGTDTLPLETFKLKRTGNDIFFIPTVNEQNGGQPVFFKLTSPIGDKLVFENMKHDYPQKITYTKISNDSILAVISGTILWQTHDENFPMGRVK